MDMNLSLAFLVEIPLVIFHISVTCCIARHILRKSVQFNSGFFILYVIQSAADLVNYVWVSEYHCGSE